MCKRCEGETSDAFVRGVATIWWASAWADHTEEHDCYNLSGCEITAHMPEIPELAWRMAERFIGKVEQANGVGMAVLFSRAIEADEPERELTHEDYHSDEAERFGECLAYMGMGAGVSWFDDHEKFKLKVPRDESSSCELQMYAGEKCENESKTNRVPCAECSAYVEPGRKCANCGRLLPLAEEADA